MRNYICRLQNINVKIDIKKLKTLLEEYKIQQVKQSWEIEKKIETLLNKKQSWFNNIYKYYKNHNNIKIAEIHSNLEKCSALLIKFYRPTYFKKDKKVTLKLQIMEIY